MLCCFFMATVSVGLLTFKATAQLPILSNLQLHTTYCSYFLISVLWIVASLGLISSILKKLILLIFASVLLAFIEEQIFGDPYTPIPDMLLFSCFSWIHHPSFLFVWGVGVWHLHNELQNQTVSASLSPSFMKVTKNNFIVK